MEPTDRLTWLAQRLILAELNHCFDGRDLPTRELADFMGYDQQALRKAIANLEALHFARHTRGPKGRGRFAYLRWSLKGKELWDASRLMMRCPVVRHYNVTAALNPEDFVPSTETLLAQRHYAYVLRSPPALAYRGASQSANVNESRITRIRRTKADYIVEFWVYPPILPGLAEIDNLSLWTALQTKRNPVLALYGGVLVDQFDFTGRSQGCFRRPCTRRFTA